MPTFTSSKPLIFKYLFSCAQFLTAYILLTVTIFIAGSKILFFEDADLILRPSLLSLISTNQQFMVF